MILLLRAALLTVVARCERRIGGQDRRHWADLPIFYYLSLDEAAQIPENVQALRGPASHRPFLLLLDHRWLSGEFTTVGVLYLSFLARLPMGQVDIHIGRHTLCRALG